MNNNLIHDLANLGKKYSLSHHELLDLLQLNDISVPLSIFNDELGSFESIVKYLREEKKLSLKQISLLTSRSVQPVRTTYNRTLEKFPGKLDCASKHRIPLKILQNKDLSVLENIVIHLRAQGLSYKDISKITKRDYKTIWTIADRARKK